MAVKLRLTRVARRRTRSTASSRPIRGRRATGVPRHRRALQPADRPVDDRPRRGEGQGLARQGRTADRGGREADQDLRHRKVGWRSCSRTSRASSSTIPRRFVWRRRARRRARPRSARCARRRRQGDRPAGPDRPRAAHAGPCELRARRAARVASRSPIPKNAGCGPVRRPRDAVGARGRAGGGRRRTNIDEVVFGGDWLDGPYNARRRSGSSARAVPLRGNAENLAEEWESARARSRRSRVAAWLPLRRGRRGPLLPRGAAGQPAGDHRDHARRGGARRVRRHATAPS